MEVEINDDAEARQRFESSLPENWVLCSSKTHTGRLYYFNSVTGESRWQHPLLPDMDSPVSWNINLCKTNATPPLQISRCDSSQTSGLDENLAKEQSLEARLAATGRDSLRSGVLFSVVTKRTADRRLSPLVVTSHSPSLLLDPSPLPLPWAEIIILRSLKLYVSYNYLFSFSSLSRNCVKIEAISVFVIFWERK